jgi:hypothetical protein
MGYILAYVGISLFVDLHTYTTCSNTPFDVSKYPGAGSYRICTVARLSIGGSSFTLLNTHFDDQSDAQRRLAASLILHRAKYEAAVTQAPVFVNGDFNRYAVMIPKLQANDIGSALQKGQIMAHTGYLPGRLRLSPSTQHLQKSSQCLRVVPCPRASKWLTQGEPPHATRCLVTSPHTQVGVGWHSPISIDTSVNILLQGSLLPVTPVLMAG